MKKDVKQRIDEIFINDLNLLCYCAERIVGDKEDARDVVSDVYLNLTENSENIHNTKALKAYICRCIHNKGVNCLKHRITEKNVNEDLDFCHQVDDLDPESILISKETMNKLEQSMEHLPLKCKKIFSLVKLEGFSYQEVAKVMNISVNTVHTQIAIAMKKLRQSLGKQDK